MKNELAIEDLFEGEDDALGRELFGALAGLRPEPADFREGVAQRIQAGGEVAPEEGDEAPLEDEVSVSGFARRAAAFLPPTILPQGLVKVGTGGALAGKFSLKFLPGILALPVISLVMIALSLGVGVRAVLSPSARVQYQSQREARYEVAAWWRRFWLPVGIMGAAGFYLLFEMPGEALVILLSVSTLAFLGIFGALARAGLANRREVGRQAGTALSWLLGLTLQFVMQPKLFGLPLETSFLVPMVIGGAAATCLILAHWGEPVRFKGVRMSLAFVFLGGVGVLSFVGPLRVRTPDFDDLNTWLATSADVDRLSDIALVVHNLEAAGIHSLDLSAVRRGVRARLDDHTGRIVITSIDVPVMAELGLLDEADYPRFRNERQVRKLLDPAGPESFRPAWALSLFVHDRLDPFTPTERAVLTDKVIASLDPEDDYTNAQDLAEAAWLLESLGAGAELARLEPIVDEVLQATWTQTVDGRKGTFVSNRSRIERDTEGHPSQDHLSSSWSSKAEAGTWLMQRFGVPAGIDLAALEAYLTEEASVSFGLELDEREAAAAAARLLLRRLPEWPAAEEAARKGLSEWLFDQRVLMAALLLASFAVLLTLLAPKSPQPLK
jgi:hypothetical protein